MKITFAHFWYKQWCSTSSSTISFFNLLFIVLMLIPMFRILVHLKMGNDADDDGKRIENRKPRAKNQKS